MIENMNIIASVLVTQFSFLPPEDVKQNCYDRYNVFFLFI